MDKQLRKKVLVIVNPVSGTKSKEDVVYRIDKAIDNKKYEIDIIKTEYAGHATEIASEAVKNKVEYVIAVGGDGTVNEVAKELINTNVVLGIIPSGSGNGLARDLHIPLNRAKAIEILNEGNIKKIDYGIANGSIFFCTCGVGFDALVSEKALSQTKRGVLMYAKNMIDIFMSYKPEKYKITSEAGVFENEAFVITCANASQYGYNAYIAPHADIQDGKMNIAVLKPLSAIDVPQAAIQMFSKNIDNNAKLVELITSEALIEREKDGVMHLDGNAVYAGKNIHVKIVKQGLNVLVPSSIPKKGAIDIQSFMTNITRWI